jgi:hypothetical protein
MSTAQRRQGNSCFFFTYIPSFSRSFVAKLSDAEFFSPGANPMYDFELQRWRCKKLRRS